MVTDHRLQKFVKILGRDHAQAVWDAGFAAIAQIERIVERVMERVVARLAAGDVDAIVTSVVERVVRETLAAKQRPT